MEFLRNVYRLGVKELWSLWRDRIMLGLIVYSFTAAIYIAATALPDSLHRAPIAVVDEDGSALANRVVEAFYPPHFLAPARISAAEVDAGMDAGRYTFALDIPPDFQQRVLRGESPAVQLNVDATLMAQAFVGAAYVQQIVLREVNDFVGRRRPGELLPAELALRIRFNPNLEQSWFGSVMETIEQITMLTMVLTGAALIREREHGTIEHLLVMPVTPAEIMLAKVWSMGLVVLAAAAVALTAVVRGALGVPIEGSLALFLACATLHVFAVASLGIFLATIARSMPQFGILTLLTLLPLQMLAGAVTPRESMPQLLQDLMLGAPTTHFVMASQAILYRGAGIDVVWPQMLALAGIGAALFLAALARFRRSITLLI